REWRANAFGRDRLDIRTNSAHPLERTAQGFPWKGCRQTDCRDGSRTHRREATQSHLRNRNMAGKTVAEQLADLKATRSAKQKELGDVAQKSIDENRSMNDAEAAQFDAADSEIKSLDADIARLTKLETVMAASATSVEGEAKANAESAPRHGVEFAQVKSVEKLEPGIAAARYAMCLVKAKGNPQVAFQLAQRHFPQTEGVVKTLKAVAEGADLIEMRKMQS